ncbi:Counting factor 60 [Smittium culicis]|uniref:Counting factor 60 n=1 Tax=Smittium culicis TaxID=133412 RepID=A0A1R1X1Q2_9FUNG|nr:Counting factor 60 [Smittium culicis]
MINGTSDDISKGQLAEMPKNNTCASGWMTEKGGLDSLDMGKATRRIYVDKLGFLKPTLKSTNQIKVRTTSSARTIQTADFFLSGLYPVTGNDTDVIINSFYLPPAIEDMTDNLSMCPKAQYLFDKIKNSDEFKEYLSQNSDYISFMNTLFTANTSVPLFTNTRTFYFDLLQPRACNNIPRPCNSDGQCTTEKMYETFRADMNWEYIYQKTMSQYSREYNILVQGFFISDLKSDLEDLVRNNKRSHKCSKNKAPRFYLYSAHDMTINNVVFSLLGDIPVTFLPPYSSNLFIEVWKNNKNGNLSVRIIYNNRILKVLGEAGSSKPWCDFNSCDYNTFINFLSKVEISDPISQCAI